MNSRIAVSIFFVFMVTFVLLIVAEKTLGHEFTLLNREDEVLAGKKFFSQHFSETKTIFLIGSSEVGAINATVVNDLVSSASSDNFAVYNLARRGNYPFVEKEHVEEILSADPKIIFYGLSYRDFKFPYEDKNNEAFLPDIEGEISKIFLSIGSGLVPSNPQILTRYTLRAFLPNEEGFESPWNQSMVSISNTPFFKYVKDPIIRTNEELKSQPVDPPNWEQRGTQYRNLESLKFFIERMKDGNVKVVIFTTPLHRFYLDSLSDSQKKSFEMVLEELSEKYDVKIYDFTAKYVDLEIWSNLNHVSYHKNVTDYNYDVAQMIVQELQ